MTESYVVPMAPDGKPIVFVKGMAVFTDSRTLAADSGKRHDHILRDIKNLAESLTPQNWGMLFSAVSEPHPTVPGRLVQYYEMTRDGFTFLALGFTGKEWVERKFRYIQQFNRMEAELRKRAIDTKPLEDPATLLALLKVHAEERLALQHRVNEMAPKVEVHDLICASDGTYTPSSAAKQIDQPPRAFHTWLHEHKWLMRQADGTSAPYQDKINRGFMILKQSEYTKPNGSKGWRAQPLFTHKGLCQVAREIYADRPKYLWEILDRIGADRVLLGRSA